MLLQGAMLSAMTRLAGFGVGLGVGRGSKLEALCPHPACEQEGSWPLVGFPYRSWLEKARDQGASRLVWSLCGLGLRNGGMWVALCGKGGRGWFGF